MNHSVPVRDKLWTTSFALILTLNFLVACTIFIQIAVMPSFILELGGTKTLVGLGMSFFSFSALLTRLLAGYLLDRIGRHKVILAGSFILLSSLILYLIVDSLPFLLLIRGLNGIAFSLVSTTIITLIADVTPDSRLREGLGFFAVSGTIASAVGPALGMIIMDLGGFFHLFGFVSALGVIIVFLGLFCNFEGEEDYVREDGSSGNGKGELKPVMFAPAILIFFLGFTMGLIFTYVPVLGIERNISRISLFFTSYSLAIVGIRVMGSRLIEKSPPFLLYLTAILLMCGTLAIMAFAHSLIFILIGAAFFGLAYGINQPLLNYMQITALPPNRKGLAGAIYFFALDTGFSLSAILFGILLERTGFVQIFLSGCLVVFLSVFLFKFIDDIHSA